MTLISGTAGPDSLADTSGDDVINGQSGDDTITLTQGGSDTVDGGDGSDRLILDWRKYGQAIVTVRNATLLDGEKVANGFAGANHAGALSVEFTRISSIDLKTATGDHDDAIVASFGDDRIMTYGGNDRVDVLWGTDQADGGDGIDGIAANMLRSTDAIVWNLVTNSFSGMAGAAFSNFEYFAGLTTGFGDDVIITSALALNDDIFTFDGDDIVVLHNGFDVADGGGGTNIAVLDFTGTGAVRTMGAGRSGGAFNLQYSNGAEMRAGFIGFTHVRVNTARVGDFDDQIQTLDGDDVVHTYGGDDIVDVGRGADRADGGAGVDSIAADLSNATGPIVWNLQTNSYSGPSGTHFTNFEAFTGQNPTIGIRTGSGDDDLTTGLLALYDTVDAGAGNDTIRIYDGFDRIHGGEGTDRLVIDWRARSQAIQTVAGPTSSQAGVAATYAGVQDSGVLRAEFSAIESLELHTSQAAALDDEIRTGSSDDNVFTYGGDDRVDVGSGTDRADGGAGTDVISANLSAATQAIVWSLETGAYSGPAGTNFVNFEAFGTLKTGSGADSIDSGRAQANERIYSGYGNDIVTVRNGSDFVDGEGGANTLRILWSDKQDAILTPFVPGEDMSGFQGLYAGQFTPNQTKVEFRNVTHIAIETSASSNLFHDNVVTAGGNDSVTVYNGSDTVAMGAGTDLLVIDWRARSGAIRTGAAPVADGQGQTGRYESAIGPNSLRVNFSGVERVHIYTSEAAGEADDIVVGTGDDKVRTYGGDDVVKVLGGADQVWGGAGTDKLIIDWSGVNQGVQTLIAPVADDVTGEGSRGSFGGGNSHILRADFWGIEQLDITTGRFEDSIRTGSGDDRVVTGAGNDKVDVGTGADYADGGDGVDSIAADLSSSTTGIEWNLRTGVYNGLAGTTFLKFEYFGGVRTGSGDDRLVSTTLAFDDIVFSGAGDDIVDVGAGLDQADGGAGFDIVSADMSTVTGAVVWSLAGNSYSGPAGTNFANFEAFDLLRTGSGNDSIVTTEAERNERIHLNGGDDRVVFRNGADQVWAGAGTDTLEIDWSNSVQAIVTLQQASFQGAGQGHNGSFGASGNNFVLRADYWNVENFVIWTSAVQDLSDTIVTGNGDDVVRTFGGDDIIATGAGNDMLLGGPGEDFMEGGTGNDIYVIDSAGDTVLEFLNEGVDEVRTSGIATYVLPNGLEHVTALDDIAHDFSDNGADNLITMGNGNDFLRLRGGGSDTIFGLGGNDAFYFEDKLGASDLVDGGAGRDQLAVQGDYTGGNRLTLGAVTDVEQFVLLSGTDTRFGAPGTNLHSYDITTTDQNVAAGQQMQIDGVRLRLGENFTFDGSAETDGSFLVWAGKGTDDLKGGAGNDGFLFRGNGNWSSSDKVDGGAGIDQLGIRGNYAGANAVVFGAGQIAGIEVLALMSGTDTRFGAAIGDASYDVTMHDANLAAGARMTVDATFLRTAETLVFDGSAEADGSFPIFGGQAADRITGSQNADSIRGGLGGDILTGAGGADTFVYRSAADSTGLNFDLLVDFDSAEDRLDLASGVSGSAGTVGTGRLDASSFNSDLAAAVDGALAGLHAILFNPDSGSFAGRRFLIVDANADGAYTEGADYVFELGSGASVDLSGTAFFV
jgi:Ca2+-binding RTX toxin-like protein